MLRVHQQQRAAAAVPHLYVGAGIEHHVQRIADLPVVVHHKMQVVLLHAGSRAAVAARARTAVASGLAPRSSNTPEGRITSLLRQGATLGRLKSLGKYLMNITISGDSSRAESASSASQAATARRRLRAQAEQDVERGFVAAVDFRHPHRWGTCSRASTSGTAINGHPGAPRGAAAGCFANERAQ